MIRKVFFPVSTAKEDYESEIRNLSILNVLKHPNIIELFAAFTYRGRHNLLFPYAENGNLQSMLDGKTQPSGFQTNLAFFLALCNLSHALEQVHDLTAHDLDLRLIGCHHDLKPENILVHNGAFLLADFGLSNFKAAYQSSSTPHRRGQGDYLAPECEDLDDDDFQKHTIHRSSDIWSFGCIILEVLTFMLGREKEVERFRSERRFKLGHFIYYTFHKGPETRNEAVEPQLDNLKDKLSSEEGRIISLARSMLSLNPTLRPTSKEVTQHLVNASILVAARPVQKLFGFLLESVVSAETYIESTRFDSWLAIWSVPEDETDLMRSREDFDFDHKAAIETLSLLETQIESSLGVLSREPRPPSLTSIRHLNTRLLRTLPRRLQSQVQVYLQTALLDTSAELIKGSEFVFGSDKDRKLVRLLASIKSMTTILDRRTAIKRPDLEIETWKIVSKQHISTDCEIAHLKTDSSYRLIVEWINYEISLQEERVGEQRHARAESRAELFSGHGEIEKLRVLRCFKYCHDSENDRFGLVFEFPTWASRPCEVVSLRQMLDSTTGWEHYPPLDAQFKLACDLVSSFLGYHQIGWLHRNINSSNIVFFPRSRKDALDVMHEPFIIGFNHSRPDEPLGFTDGPREDDDERDYHHPEYLVNHYRYRLLFEYYSLGLVLLEIGLWKSLSSLTKGWRVGNEEFKRRIRDERLFMLKHRMGNKYHEAVRRCLTSDFGTQGGEDESDSYKNALRVAFDALVVRVLHQCVV